MSKIALRVEGLSKKYLLRHEAGPRYRTLRETLSNGVRRLFAKPNAAGSSREEFWALRDVSFEIPQGEVVGIIGRNGAGKSTLLKLLSRITEPTTGRISINGRIASLLEVGTGFHPELTGRENIFLNGAILGMGRAEIRRRFDEIVAFAETETFLDTPVKHYSSGMYMRLAFAVAAHLEPDILIIDEVLAVGDAEFQRKCLGKMQEVSGAGRTVFFVSHNMSAISSLCDRAILLKGGRVELDASPEDAIRQYLAQDIERIEWVGDEGNAQLRLHRTWLRSLAADDAFHTTADLEVGVEVEVLSPIEGLVLGFNLESEYGYPLAYCLVDDRLATAPGMVPKGRHAARFVIPANTLAAGSYHIHFDIGIHAVARIIDQQGMLTFTLENVSGLGRRFPLSPRRGCTSLFRPAWSVPQALGQDSLGGKID